MKKVNRFSRVDDKKMWVFILDRMSREDSGGERSNR